MSMYQRREVGKEARKIRTEKKAKEKRAIKRIKIMIYKNKLTTAFSEYILIFIK